MRFKVRHTTTYTYADPVIHSQHRLHLQPRVLPTQTIAAHTLTVQPAPAARVDHVDSFGNARTLIALEVPHDQFIVTAHSDVTVLAAHAADVVNANTVATGDVATALAGSGLGDPETISQFACVSDATLPTPEIAAFARDLMPAERPILDATFALVRAIYEDFEFDATATDVTTPVAEVLAKRRGVCQDFSHFALSCLRSVGIPARYVSGYILTHPPPGQEKLEGADASHAWISVWAPETGWVDFDPTNGIVVRDEHVTVAYGREYLDVSPITGVLLGGGAHTINVEVDVNAITDAAPAQRDRPNIGAA